MRTSTKTYVVKEHLQLASLASGVRQEIVDVLPRLGSASVAQIAEALGRPADALYYHLRALQRVGLVVAAGDRKTGKRREALFRAVSERMESQVEPRSPKRNQALTAIVGSMMRMGIRDYRRSIRRPDVVVSGPNRDLWALRTTGWLTPAQVAKVVRLIQRLLGEVSRSKGPGRLYAATLVFTPLDHRPRERG